MRINQQKSQVKIFHLKFFLISISILSGSAWAFSFLVHIFGFFSKPEISKALFLVLTVPLFCLILFLLIRKIAKLGLQGNQKRLWAIQLCATVIIILVFILIPEKTAPFPTNHALKIEIINKTNRDSKGTELEVTQILLPGRSPVLISDLVLSGAWEKGDTNFLSWQVGDWFEYQHHFLGGIEIVFRTGPRSGMAKLTWDGKSQLIDLYSSQDESKAVKLSGSSWGKPSPLWQAIALSSVIADILTLVSLCFILFWLLERNGQLVQVVGFLWVMSITFIFLMRWGPPAFWTIMAHFGLKDSLEPFRQWLQSIFSPYPLF